MYRLISPNPQIMYYYRNKGQGLGRALNQHADGTWLNEHCNLEVS